MLLTTVLFFAVQAARPRATDGDARILQPWTWLRGIGRLWIWPGYLTRLLPAYLAYFRPGFHPDDRDTRALLTKWEADLFGPEGDLRDRLELAA